LQLSRRVFSLSRLSRRPLPCICRSFIPHAAHLRPSPSLQTSTLRQRGARGIAQHGHTTCKAAAFKTMNNLLPDLLAEVSREREESDASNPDVRDGASPVVVDLSARSSRAGGNPRTSASSSRTRGVGEPVGCLPPPFGSCVGGGGVTNGLTTLQQQQQQVEHVASPPLPPPLTRMQRFLDEVSAAANETACLRGELEAVEAIHGRQGGGGLRQQPWGATQRGGHTRVEIPNRETKNNAYTVH
jgi:hypothetical protein